MMTDEHAHEDKQTDAIADKQTSKPEPDWDALRPLDYALLVIMAGVAVCIVALVLGA